MNRERLINGLMNLVELVARLRGPGGCPWDAKQTYRTVRMYLLEEAYEVLEAIERDQPREISQELGDLLFQVVFLSYMGEEKSQFDLADVMEGIHEKMVRRHPHVFGSATVENAEEVSLNWAKIKEREKEAASSGASPIDSIPAALPSLLRAHRLGERASKATLETTAPEELWKRIEESLGSLRALDPKRDRALAREKMGGLLFDMAALSRLLGFNAEDLLREANQKYSDRIRALSAPAIP